MAERRVLYPLSRKESQRLGEHELWLDSYQENCACARTIELAIKDAYAANRLNAECARVVIKRYGFDRVNWVLAHTVQNGDYDTRFSKDQHSCHSADAERIQFCHLELIGDCCEEYSSCD